MVLGRGGRFAMAGRREGNLRLGLQHIARNLDIGRAGASASHPRECGTQGRGDLRDGSCLRLRGGNGTHHFRLVADIVVVTHHLAAPALLLRRGNDQDWRRIREGLADGGRHIRDAGSGDDQRHAWLA